MKSPLNRPFRLAPRMEEKLESARFSDSFQGPREPEDLLYAGGRDFNDWLAGSSPTSYEAIEEAFMSFHEAEAPRLPLFDERGLPIVPPADQIVDHLARAWFDLSEEATMARVTAGTVAVVSALPNCDRCRWLARYETWWTTRSGRVAGSGCAGCVRQHGGDLTLGARHSIYLMSADEVPVEVRAAIDAVEPGGASRILGPESSAGEFWAGFRRWGFRGPDSEGRIHGRLLLEEVVLEPDRFWCTLMVKGQVEGFPIGREQKIPLGLDELDAREVLFKFMGSTSRREQRVKGVELFEVSAHERDERAVRSCSSYDPYISIDIEDSDAHLYITRSADATMSRAAACESSDVELIGQLALEHPDYEVRGLALGNAVCPEQVRFEAAEVRDVHVRNALLSLPELSARTTLRLVNSILQAGRFERWSAMKLIVRQTVSDPLADDLYDRIFQEGTDARMQMAAELHKAPPERRDLLHVRLLANLRAIKSTQDVVAEVVGHERDAEERLKWLGECDNYVVRRHALKYRDAKSSGAVTAAPVGPIKYDFSGQGMLDVGADGEQLELGTYD